MFRSIKICSYGWFDSLEDILSRSTDMLPYIETVYISPRLQLLAHHFEPKRALDHPYLPRFLTLLHEHSTVKQFSLGWLSPFDQTPSSVVRWTNIRAPVQVAICRLATSPSVESIHIGHMHSLPANGLLNLHQLNTLLLHNCAFDGAYLDVDARKADPRLSDMETLEVSGNNILNIFRWLGAFAGCMPKLKRASFSSVITWPLAASFYAPHVASESVTAASVLRSLQPLIGHSLRHLDIETPLVRESSLPYVKMRQLNFNP